MILKQPQYSIKNYRLKDTAGKQIPVAIHSALKGLRGIYSKGSKMRLSDMEVLFLPDYGGPEVGHWQEKWRNKFPAAEWNLPKSWSFTDVVLWKAGLRERVTQKRQKGRPVLLVGHGLGGWIILRAAQEGRCPAQGAFLAALPDLNSDFLSQNLEGKYATLLSEGIFLKDLMGEGREVFSSAPPSFPLFFLASRDDPYCAYSKSEHFAAVWGMSLIDAGAQGHLEVASGHGPWPEGLMMLARFLKQIPQQG